MLLKYCRILKKTTRAINQKVRKTMTCDDNYLRQGGVKRSSRFVSQFLCLCASSRKIQCMGLHEFFKTNLGSVL